MAAAPPRVEQRTRVHGIELAWDSFGDPDASPLLLVMGLGAQMVAWDDDFCALLAEAGGHRVIRFDNRDIGHSSYLTELGVPDIQLLMQQAMAGRMLHAPYTLRDLAGDCVGLLDALGIARAHIVGASMGGAIGQEMCIHHAHRMLSFTSIMSTTGDPTLPPPTPEAMAVLFSPSPTTFEAYLPHYAKVWRVARAFGLSAGRGARHRARAARGPARAQPAWRGAPARGHPGLGQPQARAARRAGAHAGDPRRGRPAGAGGLRGGRGRRDRGGEAAAHSAHGACAAGGHVAADRRCHRGAHRASPGQLSRLNRLRPRRT